MVGPGFRLILGPVRIDVQKVNNPFLILCVLVLSLGLIRMLQCIRASGDWRSVIKACIPEFKQIGSWQLPLVLLILATGLRISGLAGPDFSCSDEGLYTHCAQEIAYKGNTFLKYVWIDKPPVMFYVQAFFFKVFGYSYVVACLPNFLASLILCILVYALGKHWFSEEAGIVGMTIQSVNPLDIANSTRAFLDPLMVMLFMLAVYLIEQRSFFLGGLILSLSLGTKQSAYFLLPIFFLYLLKAYRLEPTKWFLIRGKLFLYGLLSGLLPLLFWSKSVTDFMMYGGQIESYQDFSVVGWEESRIRFLKWLGRLTLTHYSWLDQTIGILIVVLLLYRLALKVRHKLVWSDSRPCGREMPNLSWNYGTLIFAIGYLLTLLTVLRFHLVDRYLLLVIPFISLLFASSVNVCSFFKKPALILCLIFLFAIQALSGANRNRYPNVYEGLYTLTRFLKVENKSALPLLEPALEWHLLAYLYDFPMSIHRYSQVGDIVHRLDRTKNAEFYLIDDTRDALSIHTIIIQLGQMNYKVAKRFEVPTDEGQINYVLYRFSHNRKLVKPLHVTQ